MTTQSRPSQTAHLEHDDSLVARHRPLIVRIAMIAAIFAVVLFATALVAPGLLTFVALMGACMLMHLFGHGGHDHGGGAAPNER